MKSCKIGLALSSGAFRGFAHIGVIKVLKENNIHIDYVSGSSIGAIIGSLYCAGADLNRISKILNHIKIKNLLDFSITKRGIISGKRIEQLLNLFLTSKCFEDLNIPFSIVATDIKSGEKYVFNKGNLISAIRASISIPGIFTPVNIDGKILVDGGVCERLPSQTVKEMGANIVIGVDVGYKLGDYYEPKTLLDVIMQSIGIIEAKNVDLSAKSCDILINPNLHNENPYSLENVDKIIEAGQIAAKEKIDSIKEIIRNYKNDSKEYVIEPKMLINK